MGKLRELIEEIAEENKISISEIARSIKYSQPSSLFSAMTRDKIEPLFENRLLKIYGYEKNYKKKH